MSDVFMDDPNYDPDDIAAVFFGVASEAPTFTVPGVDGDDGEVVDITSRSERDTGPEHDADGYDHIGRYAGHGYEGDGETERVSGNGDIRPGGRDRHNDAERALRAGREAGSRNIRRVADAHSGSNTEGYGGGESEGEPINDSVSESIRDAGLRLRTEQRSPESRDSSLIEHVLAQPDTHTGNHRPALQPITRATSQIKSVPRFKKAEVQAQLYGLKANANGNWMLTLQVPSECFEAVTRLNGAFGLELDVEISRRPIVRHDA